MRAWIMVYANQRFSRRVASVRIVSATAEITSTSVSARVVLPDSDGVVNRHRHGLGAARNIAGDHQSGAEFAQRPREGQRRRGQNRALRQRQRDAPEQPPFARAQGARRALTAAVDAFQRGARRLHQQRQRMQQRGHHRGLPCEHQRRAEHRFPQAFPAGWRAPAAPADSSPARWAAAPAAASPPHPAPPCREIRDWPGCRRSTTRRRAPPPWRPTATRRLSHSGNQSMGMANYNGSTARNRGRRNAKIETRSQSSTSTPGRSSGGDSRRCSRWRGGCASEAMRSFS